MRGPESMELLGDKLYCGEFPENFKFGTVTIAHEIEGSWEGDGKGLSMWDAYSRSRLESKNDQDRIALDEACDSYHNLNADVFLLKFLNANSYIFSLNWSRLLPDGTLNEINQTGIDYYNALIDTLQENGIEPIVTLSQNDIPYELLKKYEGGWTNPEMISEFVSFANFCFTKFGSRVKYWITVASPWLHSWKSYGSGVHPPSLNLNMEGAFRAHSNLLKAHSKVYRMYETKFRESQHGKIGISIGCGDDNEETFEIQLGRELHPLVNGTYLRREESREETYFSEEEQKELRGSFDYIVVDFYPETITNISYSTIFSQKLLNESLDMLSIILNTIKTDYGNPEVLLTFVGPPLIRSNETLMDVERAQYFNKVANTILKSIDLDECNVTGYFPGKLMDSLELESGHGNSHGLYHVDFSNRTKKRAPRASVAFMLKQLFKEKRFQDVPPY